MARPGAKRGVGANGSQGSEASRKALVNAAIEALREEGFSGASAREIARRAGCNQGLVFYHFGSVTTLLLAALDEVSEIRRVRYQTAVDDAGGLSGLVDAAATVFEEDLDRGYIAVLVEMIGGVSSTPGLGPEVAARIAPWRTFAAETMRDRVEGTGLAQVVPPEELAHGVVALYLGLEMLAHLDDDRTPALALFDRARQLSGFLEVLSGATTGKEV
jgi:AcrR family transcriptional regulator